MLTKRWMEWSMGLVGWAKPNPIQLIFTLYLGLIWAMVLSSIQNPKPEILPCL